MSAFFTPDAKRIVTGSFDGLLRIWHAASGSLLSSLDANLKGRLFDVAYSPDGQTVATVGLREGNLWRLDRMPQPRLLRGHHHAPSGVYAGVLSANGERLVAAIEQASGEHPSTVHVWNTLSGKELGSWRIPEGIYSSYALAASADLSRVVTGYGINMTWLWEAPSGRAIAQLPHSESYVRAVSISPDGQRVVSGGDDGKLHVWSGVDGTSLGTLTQYKNRLTALDISPDGRRVASTESVGILRVHDLMTHQKELEIKAHPTWIEAVEFSRDGRRLVTSGRQDHTAKVWDALSGQLRATLEGHDDGLTGASFSPDSSLIATVSEDNTARLWDAESGAELRVIHGPAFTARFSPNGQSLVTTGRGDYVATWDVTPDFRSPSAISALVGQASPWVQRNGKLVPREPN